MEKMSREALYERILEELRKRGRKIERHSNYTKVQCIFHDDHEPSLSIRLNGFRCFGCGKTGTLVDLARELGLEVEVEEAESESREIEREAVKYVASRLRMDEKQARGFMAWIGIEGGTWGNLRGIYIDLHNGDKKFRALEGKEYRHTGNSEEPAFIGLLNEFEIERHTVAVVEGTFDALTFWSLSLPAVSTEGNKYKLSTTFAKLKERGIGRVLLAFDNDERGAKYTEEAIEEALKEGLLVSVLEIPEQYKDVNEFFVDDYEGFKKTLKEALNTSLFEWYVKTHTHLLETPEKRRLLYTKLVMMYDRMRDKKTAHDMLVDVLTKYGLSHDEWLEELERLDLIRIEEQKRERLKNELRKAIQELDAGEDPSTVLHTLVSSAREYTKVDARTMAEDPELFEEGFPKDKRVTFSLLPGIELYPSDILLISAKTKAGKTTLALNLFHEVLERGLRGLYVTYELTKVQIFELFVALACGKSIDKITREDKEQVAKTLGTNGMLREGLSLDEIIALVHVFNPHVFFVDYDQLVTVRGRFESEERRVAHIAWTLKELARSTGAICVLLSQENEEERARYSREKEHCSSVHIHLEKDEDKDEIEWETRLNRWGRTKPKGKWSVDFTTRKMTNHPYPSDTLSVRSL